MDWCKIFFKCATYSLGDTKVFDSESKMYIHVYVSELQVAVSGSHSCMFSFIDKYIYLRCILIDLQIWIFVCPD